MGEIEEKELEVFIYCNISCSGISKIVSLQKLTYTLILYAITQIKLLKIEKETI